MATEYKKCKYVLSAIGVDSHRINDTIPYLFEHNPTRTFFHNINITHKQIGGRKETFNFNGTSVTFHSFVDEQRTVFGIYRANNPDKQACLIIFIDAESDIAYIDNVSFYNDCFRGGMTKGGGTLLLKIAIAFLTANKTRFKITKIQLKDNAFKYCKRSKNNINVALMSTLTTGDTWYCRHGFIPYDPDKDTVDKQLLRVMLANRKIMSAVKTKQTRVEHYIRKMAGKLDIEIEDVDGLFEHYNDMPLSLFLKQFIENFDVSCMLFGTFYVRLSNDIGLFDLHGKSFYLPLI